MLLHRESFERGFWPGLLLLGLGILIGCLLGPFRPFQSESSDPFQAEQAKQAGARPFLDTSDPPDPSDPSRQADPPDAPALDVLPTLEVLLSGEQLEQLERVRAEALDRGLIVQDDSHELETRIRFQGVTHPARVRIKGDLLDHVQTTKWSLRIALLEGRLLGMRVFSIQAPETRGHLWEWTLLAAGRRLGVLAPRSTFVNVQIAGHPSGIYYLEEHFSKELLESQGRREGPIVRFDEDTFWTTRLHSHSLDLEDRNLSLPAGLQSATGLKTAPVRAYGEDRLNSSLSLSRQLAGAVNKLRALQRRVLLSSKTSDQLEALLLFRELEGQTVEQLVDVDRLATAHALLSLFQVYHGLAWHNLRFYVDPVTDRLEPILFDNMAQAAVTNRPVPLLPAPLIQEFSRSPAYYQGVFRALGPLCSVGYLDGLFDELKEPLLRFEAALRAEGSLPRDHSVAAMLQRLRAQQVHLRRLLFPARGLNLAAFHDPGEDPEALDDDHILVDVWSTTDTPFVVEGFRFQNGRTIPAAPYHDARATGATALPAGALALPRQGVPVRFRFPLDQRLAGLENVRQIKQAIRDSVREQPRLDLDIHVLYRSIATDQVSEEPLEIRRGLSPEPLGRPAPPTLDELLTAHPFLEPDPERMRLRVRPGRWEIDGDLIIPKGLVLTVFPGTELLFDEAAVLLTESALEMYGTEERPVILGPRPGSDFWSGVVVLNASERSVLQHVVVRETNAVKRGGWMVTGGLTFYRSPVTLQDCRVEGALAEDGVNVFGTDLLFERVVFTGCASDSFDGDFVTGAIRDCVFRDGRADGVDLSGSDVELSNCEFLDLDDKAISAGEDTRLSVLGGRAQGVSIGVASKDRSNVTIKGFELRDVRNFGLAAFIKKPEYGPSELTAAQVTIENAGRGNTLCQTGCTLSWNGTEVATEEIDVEQLYRDRILGQ